MKLYFPTSRRLALLPIFLLIVGLTSGLWAADETALGDRVWVSRLSEHVWIVRSEFDFKSFGTVPSNALVVVGDTGSILLDTPVTEAQTERVFVWAEKTLQKPIARVVATHAHDDRLGGLDVASKRGIPSDALARTIALAKERKVPVPDHALKHEDTVSIPGATVHTYFPGHGHTEDNIVVWIPVDRVLHGGCFVKGADATNLGNLAEINPPTWRVASREVMERYKQATIVIPGHGDPGDMGLLRHTLALIDAHPTKARARQ